MPSKQPMGDVIVLLPGILGSVLERDGRDVWAMSPGAAWRAIRSLGRSVNDLELHDDDPSVDDLGDGVTAPRLVPDLHLIPGLWSIDGYSHIRSSIFATFDVVEGQNWFDFPYDWRRDNRVAARHLAEQRPGWLRAWRQRSGNNDAKLVLVGHSMGGLVARHYLEVLGGWRDTRMLVTFGTPYRGSLNALDFLCNGFKKKIGPIGVDLTRLLRSLTSVYQLLPRYPVVDAGTGELTRVAETAGPAGRRSGTRRRRVAVPPRHRCRGRCSSRQQLCHPPDRRDSPAHLSVRSTAQRLGANGAVPLRRRQFRRRNRASGIGDTAGAVGSGTRDLCTGSARIAAERNRTTDPADRSAVRSTDIDIPSRPVGLRAADRRHLRCRRADRGGRDIRRSAAGCRCRGRRRCNRPRRAGIANRSRWRRRVPRRVGTAATGRLSADRLGDRSRQRPAAGAFAVHRRRRRRGPAVILVALLTCVVEPHRSARLDRARFDAQHVAPTSAFWRSTDATFVSMPTPTMPCDWMSTTSFRSTRCRQNRRRSRGSRSTCRSVRRSRCGRCDTNPRSGSPSRCGSPTSATSASVGTTSRFAADRAEGRSGSRSTAGHR